MVFHVPHQLPGLTFSGFCEFIQGILVDADAISEVHIQQLFDYFDRVNFSYGLISPPPRGTRSGKSWDKCLEKGSKRV